MVLVDFSHLAHRLLFTSIQVAKPRKVNGKYDTEGYQNLLIHQILNNIQYFIKDFKEYGEVIVCMEGSSWRKKFYPLYKAQRQDHREESDVDFIEFYKVIDELSIALKEYFGIKVLSYKDAEGDDVIATLAKLSSQYRKKTVIISSDKDFVQLMKYPYIDIYDPLKREYRPKPDNISDIEATLRNHIIKGDAVDNIPSIFDETEFSKEFLDYLKRKDVFITNPKDFFKLEVSKKLVDDYDVYEVYKTGKNKGKKKETKNIYKTIVKTQKKIDELLSTNPEDPENPYYEEYMRNKTLIDLDYIPEDVKEGILESYKNMEHKNANSMKMMEYCAKYSLKQIMATQATFLLNKQEVMEDEW